MWPSLSGGPNLAILCTIEGAHLLVPVERGVPLGEMQRQIEECGQAKAGSAPTLQLPQRQHMTSDKPSSVQTKPASLYLGIGRRSDRLSFIEIFFREGGVYIPPVLHAIVQSLHRRE